LFRALYGAWLPNTYYVKSDAGLTNVVGGIRYLVHAGARYAPVLLALAFAAGRIKLRQPRSARAGDARGRAGMLLAVAAAWIIYVALQGGDNLVGGRVLLPALPLLYTAVAALSADVRPRDLALATALIGALLVVGYARDERVQKLSSVWRRNHEILRSTGIYLRDHFPPGTKVALNAAGIVPYYSGLPTIDMLGLNDRHIARSGKRDRSRRFGHQAGDGAYVLRERPAVILFGGTPSELPGQYVSDQEIWNSPEFRGSYVLVEWEGIGPAYVRGEAVDPGEVDP
jgi:hypothetical protein